MKKLVFLIVFLFFVNSVFAYDSYVGSGQTFGDCFTCGLDWSNNSVDSVVINGSGSYTLGDYTLMNFSGLKVCGISKSDQNHLLNNSPDVVSEFGDMLIGYDVTGVGTGRGLVRFKQEWVNNSMLQGGFVVDGLYLYAQTVRDYTFSKVIRVLAINVSNDWVTGFASWNDQSSGVGWAGSPGLSTSGMDYLDINDSNVTVGATSKYYRFFVNTSLVLSWQNGSFDNNGLLIRRDNDTAKIRNYVSFDSGSGFNPPYLLMNVSDVNVTASESYYLFGDGIEVVVDDVVIDCDGAVLFGDGGTSDYGLSIPNGVNNVTVSNCVFDGFGYGIHIGSASNITIINVSAIGSRCVHSLGDDINFTNFVCNHSTSNYGNVVGGDNLIFDGYFVNNCTSSQYCFSTDTVTDSSFNNVFINKTNSTGTCFSLSSGGTNSNNSFSNFSFFCDGANGFLFGNAVNNSFVNGVINDFLVGFDAVANSGDNEFVNISFFNGTVSFVIASNFNSVNNSFFNLLSGTGVNISGDDNVIFNNSFNLTGDSYSESQFLASQISLNFGGVDGNALHAYTSADLATTVGVTSDDTDVSSLVIGSNDFDAWLLSAPGAGIPLPSTLLVDSAVGFTCVQIATIYGGTCYHAEEDYFVNNGATNSYSRNLTSLFNITTGFTDPAYLNYNLNEVQNHSSLLIVGDRNNVSNNLFLNDSSPIYFSVNVSGDDNVVWGNNFLFGRGVDGGSDNVFCVGNKGNFFSEGLSAFPGDCGVLNFSNELFVDNVANVTWSDSGFDVSFDVFTGVWNGVLSFEGNQTITNFVKDWSGSESAKHWFWVVPYYLLDGVRYNASSNYSSKFDVDIPGGTGTGTGDLPVVVPVVNVSSSVFFDIGDRRFWLFNPFSRNVEIRVFAENVSDVLGVSDGFGNLLSDFSSSNDMNPFIFKLPRNDFKQGIYNLEFGGENVDVLFSYLPFLYDEDNLSLVMWQLYIFIGSISVFVIGIIGLLIWLGRDTK